MDLLQPAVCGRHAEYLLPLTSSCEPQLLQAGPTFQYVVPADEKDARMDLEQFDLEEKVSTISGLCLHSPLLNQTLVFGLPNDISYGLAKLDWLYHSGSG